MILSSIPTLLKINLRYLELFFYNFSRLLKIRGLKYIYVLFEFKHTEFFTSHGGYLLNNKLLKVPGVGFLVAGLDFAKFGFYQFPIFTVIVVIVILILVKTTF